MRGLIVFVATAGYTGFAPYAPGTAGSVVGLIVSWAIFGGIWQLPWPIVVPGFAVIFVAACWISGRAEEILNQPDSSHIVIDEVLGMVATMFQNPIGWGPLIAGFGLFRLFDIVKPFPAGFIDRRMRGGAGVMLDDLAAAIYANIVLRLIVHFVWPAA
ncbi:MAG TPA: phosphatidylglycerophosphatase A [Candidatus Binataceae bacterium]|nr:phosphatidylglycerophosphatase A [Candidatus Binataceae bacterium]